LRRPKEETARRLQFAPARKAQPNESLLNEFFRNLGLRDDPVQILR